MKGSVYRRGKVWWFKVELGYDDEGRRIRHQQGGFRTKAEAEIAKAAVITRFTEGTYVSPSTETVRGFLVDEWLPAIKSTIRESTYGSYEMNVRKHILPSMGHMRLQAVTPRTLNELYSQLLREGRSDGRGGLSPKSVRNVHILLRRALGDAVKWGLAQRNPAQFATPPKLSRQRELTTWTADQLRTFLAFIQDHHLYAAWRLAASTGMRRGEVLGLRWADIDFDQSRLAVRQTVITVDYQIRYSEPKTDRARRSIALDAATLAALRAHKTSQTKTRLKVGAAYADNDLVFPRLEGTPIHPDLFSQTFDRKVAASGLPRIRFHDLRHTHATLALQAGIHPKVVSERLGHASVSFTLDTYSHAIPAMQAEAAEVIARLIAEQEPWT